MAQYGGGPGIWPNGIVCSGPNKFFNTMKQNNQLMLYGKTVKFLLHSSIYDALFQFGFDCQV